VSHLVRPTAGHNIALDLINMHAGKCWMWCVSCTIWQYFWPFCTWEARSRSS